MGHEHHVKLTNSNLKAIVLQEEPYHGYLATKKRKADVWSIAIGEVGELAFYKNSRVVYCAIGRWRMDAYKNDCFPRDFEIIVRKISSQCAASEPGELLSELFAADDHTLRRDPRFGS
ncbi:MAG TPA: hypothetical protein DEF04_00360 [Clostridiales bacterium]|nr:hypothetical protein [Clostridiales bacterium]